MRSADSIQHELTDSVCGLNRGAIGERIRERLVCELEKSEVVMSDTWGQPGTNDAELDDICRR